MAHDIQQMNNASSELSEQQEARLSDRKWIIGRIEVLLNDFYRKDLGEAFDTAAQIQWADVLEGLPREAINKGCIDYQRNGPRSQATNKLIKPAAGDIYRFSLPFIPRPKVVAPARDQEPERHISSPEEKARVQQMIKDAGFGLRRVDPYYD